MLLLIIFSFFQLHFFQSIFKFSLCLPCPYPFSENHFVNMFSSISHAYRDDHFLQHYGSDKKIAKNIIDHWRCSHLFCMDILHEMFDVIMNMSQSYGIFYGSMRNYLSL